MRQPAETRMLSGEVKSFKLRARLVSLTQLVLVQLSLLLQAQTGPAFALLEISRGTQ